MSKLKVSGVLKAVVKVRGGVKVDHQKNTAETEVVRIPEPQKVVLPMQQHIGAPCTPTVKVGDTVAIGQVIGDSDKFVSAPIHASVSGKVSAIGNVKLPNGAVVQGVTIESDGERRLYDGIEPPKADTKEEFLKAVRASGLVGLGGAGFPTHVKLNVPPDKNVDTLVINAAECEPYITVDYRECIDNSWDILSGIHIIKDMLGIENVIIAVENNKPKAFEVLKRIADSDNYSGDHTKLMSLESRYPQGAEKMMVQSATGRKVPPGKLPADVGCIVMNVASVAFVARYIKTGKPLVSRSLTVDGSAIAEPKNVRVPIGTSIADIIDFCGGFKEEPRKIITGGPMMGLSITGTDLPVIKNNNAILAFTEKDAKLMQEGDCIRCGRCAAACPMSLVPTLIERYTKAGDTDALKKIGVNVCMECGSCAYSCPAKKPLVQTMRAAKAFLREAGDNK
ncbi:MAG: electron transport complex subunit RsxC [Oscillospiraceae bacterium]|nr:electron transport complex subunit RsxC [Oscillospiraceae bacterium]